MIFLIAAAATAMNPCESAGTQAESTQCAWNDFKRADAELNAQYRRSLSEAAERDRNDRINPTVRRDTRPSYTEALREAQRAWTKFRDLHCKVEGYWGRGGTIEPMLVNFCLARVARERTEQLRMMWHRR
jgi:uncharacterized protein YecT (DUF1311 family)